MNLLRIGERVLNLDNVASVNLAYPTGVKPEEGATVRVFFTSPGPGGSMVWTEFEQEEAQALRLFCDHEAVTPEEWIEREREIQAYLTQRSP